MINGRHHCLNTALELELGTLPCSTECDARDMEPVSPPAAPRCHGWALLLGLRKATAEETGRDWPFQSGRNHPPRGREEAARLKCFYLIISNGNAGVASGAPSETLPPPQRSAAARRGGFVPRCSLLVGVRGCWSPASVGEGAVHRHCRKGRWFASSAQVTRSFPGVCAPVSGSRRKVCRRCRAGCTECS